MIEDSVSFEDSGDGFSLCKDTREYSLVSTMPSQLDVMQFDTVTDGKLSVNVEASVNSGQTVPIIIKV